jgi:hypothetical protein
MLTFWVGTAPPADPYTPPAAVAAQRWAEKNPPRRVARRRRSLSPSAFAATHSGSPPPALTRPLPPTDCPPPSPSASQPPLPPADRPLPPPLEPAPHRVLPTHGPASPRLAPGMEPPRPADARQPDLHAAVNNGLGAGGRASGPSGPASELGILGARPQRPRALSRLRPLPQAAGAAKNATPSGGVESGLGPAGA